MTDKEILKAFNQQRKKEQSKIVVRPKFTLYKELIFVIIAVSILSVTLRFHSELSKQQFYVLLCLELVVFFISQTKNILLLLVFLYQKAAPIFIREACLFTPSCSEYMRLSILKYGVCKGVLKGFKRLRRCHPPNGGVDEP